MHGIINTNIILTTINQMVVTKENTMIAKNTSLKNNYSSIKSMLLHNDYLNYTTSNIYNKDYKIKHKESLLYIEYMNNYFIKDFINEFSNKENITSNQIYKKYINKKKFISCFN
jgi:hypothetical protein